MEKKDCLGLVLLLTLGMTPISLALGEAKTLYKASLKQVESKSQMSTSGLCMSKPLQRIKKITKQAQDFKGLKLQSLSFK